MAISRCREASNVTLGCWGTSAIPDDPDLRFNLIAWFGWATAMLNHHWPAPEDVPSDLPLPGWDWDGTDGW